MSKPTSFARDKDFHRFRAMMGQAVGLQQRGDFAGAEAIYAQILAETPDQPDVLHYLGLLKHQSGNGAEAVRLMKQGIGSGLPNPGYYYNLGGVLQQQGQLLEALEYLEKAVALTPSYAAAWNRMGETYEDLGMAFKAAEHYRKAHEQEPATREYTLNLVRALRQTGELKEANELCEAALKAEPGDVAFAFFQTQCLIDSSRAEEAVEKLRAALRAEPLSAPLQHGMGMVLSELGRFDQAKEHFGKALAIDPQFYGAYFSLSNIQDFAGDEKAADELEKRVQQSPPRDPLAGVSAEFTLGKMFDDQGRHEQAFTHFRRGNQAMRALHRYSTAAQKMYSDSLMQHLDAKFMAGHPAAAHDSEAPVFILGMMRSGTSLVEQILAGHSQVAGGGELMFLPQAMRKYTETPTVVTGDKIAALPDETLKAIGAHYLAKLEEFYPGKQRVTDKLPGNFMIVGLIRTLFPKARIIHCVRDPLDTCFSCYVTHFDGGHPYAYDLQEVGEYYRMYQGLMDHYQKLIGDEHILTVRYEELVQDVEAGARRMLKFCGLKWEPGCIEFSKVARPVKTASLYQVRQGAHTRSVGRAQKYAAHLEPLRKALGLG